MNKLFEEVARCAGNRAENEIELFEQLEFLNYEGVIHNVDVLVLREFFPELAFFIIQNACGGVCVGGGVYSHEFLRDSVTQSGIESGKFLSDSLVDVSDWNWYDFYFDSVESIIQSIQKRRVFK